MVVYTLEHYAGLSEPAIDLQKVPILAKSNHLFRWSSFWSWRVCIQAKLSCIRLNNARLNEPAIDLQKIPILAKTEHHFRWSSFWSWRVCKQAKMSHLMNRKPALIYWKAETHKTSHCLLRSLVQRYNWATFLPKMTKERRYSQLQSLSGHVERIFVH